VAVGVVLVRVVAVGVVAVGIVAVRIVAVRMVAVVAVGPVAVRVVAVVAVGPVAVWMVAVVTVVAVPDPPHPSAAAASPFSSSLFSGLDISEGSRLQHLKICRSVVGVGDGIGELGIDESRA
jgi:hypothetical protein